MKTSTLFLSSVLFSALFGLSTPALAGNRKNILVTCYEKNVIEAGTTGHVWGFQVNIIDKLKPEVVDGVNTGRWISKGNVKAYPVYALSNSVDPLTYTRLFPEAETFATALTEAQNIVSRSEDSDTLFFENAEVKLAVQKNPVQGIGTYTHEGVLAARVTSLENSQKTVSRQSSVLCQIFNH